MAGNNNAIINVTPEELRQAAIRIDNINLDLGIKLGEISNKINQLCDGSWDSRAGEATQGKINTFAGNHFGQFQQAVKAFTIGLRNIADNYDEKEGNIKTLTSQFQE